MKILEKQEPKEVAQDFYIGNTHVRIATDYCRPPEEVPEILRRIARNAQRAFAAQRLAEKRKANEEKAL
ncbi:MAG: hypothetical protein J6C38_01720 [Oscillospiraceae bacterium]|nr:hypothetical protein [Oscillospiraceae bacterium]